MIDVRGKRIYLSGPMTGKPDYNVAAFAVAHARLNEVGADYIYDPAIRYLALEARKAEVMTHEDYLCDCIHELTQRKKRSQGWETVIPMRYDMVVMLEGWEDSEGAMHEAAVADACGIPVHEIAEVLG